MATEEAVRLGRAAGDVLREDGVRELSSVSADYFRARKRAATTRLFNRCGGLAAARASLAIRRRVRPGSVTDADPFELVSVDPCAIDHLETTTPQTWGRVRGGDWDRSRERVEETAEFRGISAHFADGVPWDETAKWEGYVRRLERGETPKGCETVEQLRRRLERVDEIYERIRTEGYRSQRDLWKHDPGRQRALFYKWGRTIDPVLDEVTVTIGRDGRLFHRGRGNHRLTIARLLDLAAIPVLVRTRHEGWQATRDEIRAAGSIDALSEDARAALDHPDVRDLRPVADR